MPKLTTNQKFASASSPDITPYAPTSPEEIMRLGGRIAGLVAEHDDLDSAIAALLESGAHDDLLITRLKKRKLHLKDEIALAGPFIAARPE